MSKERWLCRCRRAKRSYFTFKVGRGGGQRNHTTSKELWLGGHGRA